MFAAVCEIPQDVGSGLALHFPRMAVAGENPVSEQLICDLVAFGVFDEEVGVPVDEFHVVDVVCLDHVDDSRDGGEESHPGYVAVLLGDIHEALETAVGEPAERETVGDEEEA